FQPDVHELDELLASDVGGGGDDRQTHRSAGRSWRRPAEAASSVRHPGRVFGPIGANQCAFAAQLSCLRAKNAPIGRRARGPHSRVVTKSFRKSRVLTRWSGTPERNPMLDLVVDSVRS